MAAAEVIEVEVAYAQPQQQWLVRLELARGATVADALRVSGLCASCPEINLERDGVGIFSRRVALTEVLQDGDRVEIYRPLQVDPKEARRARAARAGRGPRSTSAR
jgi:putative ubiquitin-RnfH superfamily antitoxin RatB of RatAB toxin-antitoxin module